ncbi:hypothetical protein IFM89_026092 [Coptis chinensis]|uniref:F-box domain-containing protein n=1 Tax=Coptis chinensis TaxID=261450 RepID=A0A835HEB4_9MAGN|nr:hypothetical protein IFM89_026092 [Coptis chinensis]
MVNGCLHWITTSHEYEGFPLKERGSPVMISFHLGVKEFGFVPTPESHLLKYPYYQYALGELEGCLSFGECSSELFFKVWVINKYNDNDSWVKQFSIEHDSLCRVGSGLKYKYVELLKVSMDGEVLLVCGNKDLVSYNDTSGKCRMVGIEGVQKGDRHFIEAHPLVGNLLSLKSAFGMDGGTRKIGRDEKLDNLSGGVGQRFELGAAEFRLKVLEFSIATGYKYKFTKNDECRVTAIYGKRLETNCLWLIHASDKFGAFAIRKINPIHTYGFACKDYNNPPMTSNLVKSLIMDLRSDTPSISVRTIIRYFKKEYGLTVKKHVAYMGKQLALKELYGEEDGTFLSTKYKGCLMVATRKNGDQGLYPLAMGVVDGEDEANWYWFLDKFKGAFGYNRRYTFLSDRHHGLLVNIPLVFPGSYHSFCLWHLKNNLRAALSKTDSVSRHLVKLFSDCAYAPTHNKFQEKMIELQTIGGDQVDRFLAKVPLENWANSCFRGSRYGEMCSSLAECFNSWVKGERFLPITSMLDEIRNKMMSMVTERRKDSKGWATILCPQMELKLAERIDKARSLDVIRSDDYVFQVISKNMGNLFMAILILFSTPRHFIVATLTEMEKLPKEITSSILSRLPFKKSAQCKCVSKLWCTILSDSSFPKLQLTQHLNIHPDILLFYKLQNRRLNIFYIEDNHNEEAPNVIKTKPFQKTGTDFITETFYGIPTILGACNAFICISEINVMNISFLPRNPIYVFNPITKETAELPNFTVPKRDVPDSVDEGKKTDKCLSGFGYYDSVFKLVLVIFTARNYHAQIFNNEVQILTLGSSSWRRKKSIVPMRLRRAYKTVSAPIVNGCLHWITTSDEDDSFPPKEGGSPSIVSLHLGVEEFGFVPTPESHLIKHTYFEYSLGVLEGYLSFMECSSEPYIQVWVMKKYNDKESWVKKFCIEHDSLCRPGTGLRYDRVELLQVSKTGGELLLVCGNKDLVSYNISTGMCRLVEIEGVWKRDELYLEAHPFVGNLISLKSAFRMDSGARKMGREEKMNRLKQSIFELIKMRSH